MLKRILCGIVALALVAALPAASRGQAPTNSRVLSNGQVATSTTAAQCLAPNIQRVQVILYNADSTNDIYVGSNNGPVGGPAAEVSSTNGFLVPHQAAGTTTNPPIIIYGYTGDLRCVASASTPKLHYIELSR